MAPTDLSVQEQRAPAHKQRVANDFSIQVATVNGSGSQTANLVLLRSILLACPLRPMHTWLGSCRTGRFFGAPHA